MAIRKIARMGHEVLRRVSEPIADPTAPEIARLAQDLIDTCEDIGGNGIAAPQVYEPVRCSPIASEKRSARRCEHVGDPERRHQSDDHTVNRKRSLLGALPVTTGTLRTSTAIHQNPLCGRRTRRGTYRIHRASVPCPAASA